MAIILCHSVKGGAGTTFVAAHLAHSMVQTGAEVSVLSVTPRDTLPFHFGLPPSVTLPSIFAPADAAVIVSGIKLCSYLEAADDPDFLTKLRDDGYLEPGLDRVMVLDVPALHFQLARRVIPVASAFICMLNAGPDTLALMPRVLEEADPRSVDRSAFVINALDETRRLARHNAAFLRELLGDRLLGRIRLDEAVPEAIAMLQPLQRYAPSCSALADVEAVGNGLLDLLKKQMDPCDDHGVSQAV